MQEFGGKVAVITGGASGIGLGLARHAAAEGMRVVIGDVEEPALEAAVAGLRESGAEVEGVPTDVTDAAQMDALANVALDRFGAIHLFCNNAGVGGGGISWETPLSTWEWVIGVNLWGVINGVHTMVPHLVEQSEAHIVNTASIAGLVAAPFMGPYNASKHAVVAISETLFHEFAFMAPHVHVSVLCPGWVNTRIAESARNRPAHLTDADGEVDQGQVLRGVIEAGMSTKVVADKVFAAIRDERFWVLTHEDPSEFFVSALERRLESLRTRENPTLGGGQFG